MDFAVATTGVGRKDYTGGVEASTEAFIGVTPTQAEYTSHGYWTLPCGPFPFGYQSIFWQLQEDGSWGPEADLPLLLNHARMSISDSLLVAVGLRRYASLSDYMAGILAERIGFKWGYGHSEIKFLRGIRTVKGSVYSIFYAAWGGITFDVALTVTGLASELTPPWWR